MPSVKVQLSGANAGDGGKRRGKVGAELVVNGCSHADERMFVWWWDGVTLRIVRRVWLVEEKPKATKKQRNKNSSTNQANTNHCRHTHTLTHSHAHTLARVDTRVTRGKEHALAQGAKLGNLRVEALRVSGVKGGDNGLNVLAIADGPDKGRVGIRSNVLGPGKKVKLVALLQVEICGDERAKGHNVLDVQVGLCVANHSLAVTSDVAHSLQERKARERKERKGKKRKGKERKGKR